MATEQLNLEENEIHYVYDNSQFVLNSNDSCIKSDLGDIIYADGSQAILVNGQYLVPSDNQAFYFEADDDENITPLYINNDYNNIIIDGGDGDDTGDNNLNDNTNLDCAEYVQLIKSGDILNDDDNNEQIYYYDESSISQLDNGGIQDSIQDNHGNILPLKRIKLENQIINFDDYIQQQQDSASFIGEMVNEDDNSNTTEYQYAVLEDGNYQICTIEPEEEGQQEQAEEEEEGRNIENSIDLSKITGRNLLTGQTVTLHGYMEKLMKKINNNNNNNEIIINEQDICSSGSSSSKSEDLVKANSITNNSLDNLIDKKISIGKTKSGKNIIGRIIHVGKKCDLVEQIQNVDDNIIENDSSQESEKVELRNEKQQTTIDDTDKINNNNDNTSTTTTTTIDDTTKILIKKCNNSKDYLDVISKTLSGLMEMESIRKKLEDKNIVVKLLQKKYCETSKTFQKNTTFSYGYLIKEINQFNKNLIDIIHMKDKDREVEEISDNECIEKWRFISDKETQDAILLDSNNSDGTEKKCSM